MNKENSINEMVMMIKKKDLAEIYYDLNKTHRELVKWLYDNHKPTLREWEKTKGKLRIEFLGEEMNNQYRKDKNSVQENK